MTLEQPGLGSDPPNGSGRERGATARLLALRRQEISDGQNVALRML